MKWWQIVWIACAAITCIENIRKDGQVKPGRYSIWGALLSLGLNFMLLYFSGFWEGLL